MQEEIRIHGLHSAIYKGTLFEDLSIVDYRNPSDFNECALVNQRPLIRVVARWINKPEFHQVQKRATPGPDLRYNPLYRYNNNYRKSIIWPIVDIVPAMRKAIACGDCTDGSYSENQFTISKKVSMSDEKVFGAFLSDKKYLNYPPLYLEGDFDNFVDAVDLLISASDKFFRDMSIFSVK